MPTKTTVLMIAAALLKLCEDLNARSGKGGKDGG
jgi:hypothetical protein